MKKKTVIIAGALLFAPIAMSAQWILSGNPAGDHAFSEKSAGVYELSLPNDTIYGRFVLKNGDDVLYGATNTYVCGSVPYSYTTEGDSLMFASSIVSPILTLNTNDGTLTASGNVQPLYALGEIKGISWDCIGYSPEIKYEGNGLYSIKGLQMSGRALAITQIVLPATFPRDPSSLRGDAILPYRIAPVSSATKNIEWGVASPLCNCPLDSRGKEINFTLPECFALIDLSVNMVDATLEVSGHYNFNLENLYLIGSKATHNGKTVQWDNTGCDNGFPMTYNINDNVTTFSITDVRLQSSDENQENPQSKIIFTEDLGSWKEMQDNYAFGARIKPDTLTLTNSKISKTLNVPGKELAPYSLPTGTYDITVTIDPTKSPTFQAVQTSTSALESIADSDSDENQPTEWFDLEGRKISEPQKNGIYIRRRGMTSNKVWIYNIE